MHSPTDASPPSLRTATHGLGPIGSLLIHRIGLAPTANCRTPGALRKIPYLIEMSVWNVHYACTCYHPLFVFNQFGDLERCALRAGNVHSADGWDDVLKPVVARYQGKVSRIYFRADAAFAMPEVYEFPEAERIKYAIRLPANQVLQ